MKHIHHISAGAPRAAALWQEIVCDLNHLLAGLLEAKGGSSPFIAVIEDKCDLPVS